MRVYILSENMYFTEGMVRLMARAGYTTHVLRFEDKIDPRLFHHGSPCVVFADAKRIDDCLESIMNVEVHCLLKIFCISGHFSKHEFHRNNFVSLISRRTSGEEIVLLLNQLSKEPQRKVGANDSRLSSRELTILYYLFKGNSQKEISDKLNLSIKTISAYKARALLKLGVERISLKSIPYVRGYISRAPGDFCF
ncbi:LuxR C-terminal-related transcriptional regulator [Dryocola sp. BD586]|uniref:LuxR C-terminal-related transcriptional regulator n=1 Tax=Dryocola sp. BD586 TaxID=3133271 RepID=UPI003F4F4E46